MRRKGFTLIELLVVIAIIAILATVIVVNLNSGRDRAKATNALSSLKSAQMIAIQCRDANVQLTATIAGGDAICSALTDTWPTLTSYSWDYNTAAAAIDNSDYATILITADNATAYWKGGATDSVFSYGAIPSSGANQKIRCNQAKCEKLNF